MTITASTTLKDLAFIVCTALDQSGIKAVLTGGGAATVYAPEAYQSRDLDFILSYQSSIKSGSAKPLIELGFSESGGVYRHPSTPFPVEFPPGPLAIGDEIIRSFDTIRDANRVLHILTPTDCVRDRLSWFLYNNDYAGLDQAVVVAKSQIIDIELVRRWCSVQDETRKFDLFLARLANQ